MAVGLDPCDDDVFRPSPAMNRKLNAQRAICAREREGGLELQKHSLSNNVPLPSPIPPARGCDGCFPRASRSLQQALRQFRRRRWSRGARCRQPGYASAASSSFFPAGWICAGVLLHPLLLPRQPHPSSLVAIASRPPHLALLPSPPLSRKDHRRRP